MKSLSKVIFSDSNSLPKVAPMLAQFSGKWVEVTVRFKQRTRSKNQNAYYWGVVIPTIRDWFFENGEPLDDEEVHTLLKTEVGKLRRAIPAPDGKYYFTLKSTTKLTTAEFEDYLTIIRSWAAQNGCMVPLPNEIPDNLVLTKSIDAV